MPDNPDNRKEQVVIDDKKENPEESPDVSAWRTIMGLLLLVFCAVLTVAVFFIIVSLVVGLWKLMWYVIGL